MLCVFAEYLATRLFGYLYLYHYLYLISSLYGTGRKRIYDNDSGIRRRGWKLQQGETHHHAIIIIKNILLFQFAFYSSFSSSSSSTQHLVQLCLIFYFITQLNVVLFVCFSPHSDSDSHNQSTIHSDTIQFNSTLLHNKCMLCYVYISWTSYAPPT